MSLITRQDLNEALACINVGAGTPLALNTSIGVNNIIASATAVIPLSSGNNIHFWNSDGTINLSLSTGAAIGFTLNALGTVNKIIGDAGALTTLQTALGFTPFTCASLAGCSLASLGTRNYSDLTGVPTNLSDFINGPGFLTDITLTPGVGISIVKNGLGDFTVSSTVSGAGTNQYIESFGVPTVVSGAHTVASTFNTGAIGPDFTITEVDPTVPAHVKAITAADIVNWNANAPGVDTNLLGTDLLQGADRTHDFSNFSQTWNNLDQWTLDTNNVNVNPIFWTLSKPNDITSYYIVGALGSFIAEENLVSNTEVKLEVSAVKNTALLIDQISITEVGLKEGKVIIKTPAVTASSALVGQVPVLVNATTGEVEYQSITPICNVRTITSDSNYTTLDAGGTVLIQATANTVNYQLPAANTVTTGTKVIIKAQDITFNSTINVALAGTIDQTITYTFTSTNEAVQVQSTGTEWILLP